MTSSTGGKHRMKITKNSYMCFSTWKLQPAFPLPAHTVPATWTPQHSCPIWGLNRHIRQLVGKRSHLEKIGNIGEKPAISKIAKNCFLIFFPTKHRRFFHLISWLYAPTQGTYTTKESLCCDVPTSRYSQITDFSKKCRFSRLARTFWGLHAAILDGFGPSFARIS